MQIPETEIFVRAADGRLLTRGMGTLSFERMKPISDSYAPAHYARRLTQRVTPLIRLMAAVSFCALILVAGAPSSAAPATLTRDDFTVASAAVSPRVSWAVRGENSALVFTFEVESWPGVA